MSDPSSWTTTVSTSTGAAPRRGCLSTGLRRKGAAGTSRSLPWSGMARGDNNFDRRSRCFSSPASECFRGVWKLVMTMGCCLCSARKPRVSTPRNSQDRVLKMPSTFSIRCKVRVRHGRASFPEALHKSELVDGGLFSSWISVHVATLARSTFAKLHIRVRRPREFRAYLDGVAASHLCRFYADYMRSRWGNGMF